MCSFCIMPRVGWETDELFLFWLPCDTPSDTSSVWQNLHPAWKSALRWLRCIHPHSFSTWEIKSLICINNSLPVQFKRSKKLKLEELGVNFQIFCCNPFPIPVLWHWVTTRGRIRWAIRRLPLCRIDETQYLDCLECFLVLSLPPHPGI